MTQEKFNYLLVLAEEQNMTKAAKRLYISQPSLTSYINRLESNLGFHIFDRSHTPILLTPSGKTYIERMRLILADEEHLKEELRFRETMIQTIRIGIGYTHSVLLCPELVERLNDRYPNLNVEIFEGGENDLMKQMKNGNLDLFLGPSIIDTLDFVFGKLWDEHLRLLIPKKFLANTGGGPTDLDKRIPYEITASQLADIPTIIPSGMLGLYLNYRQMTIELGLHPAHVIQTRNMLTGIRMVARGLGFLYNSPDLLSLLPEEDRNNIAICSIDGLDDTRGFFFGYSEKNVRLDVIRDILDILKEASPHSEHL